MYVLAIRLDKSDELHHKILSAMFGNEKKSVQVDFAELAKKLGVSKEVIRYNVKKLKILGCIDEDKKDKKYEPTEKVIFIRKA